MATSTLRLGSVTALCSSRGSRPSPHIPRHLPLAPPALQQLQRRAPPPARDTRAAYTPDSNPTSTFAEARVEEIMSPHPVLLKRGTSCKEAARALLANDCSSAAVVDDSGKLLGVLSESDLLWKGAGAPLDHTIIPPVFVGAFDLLISLRDDKQVKQELEKILARTVEQAMSKEPITISPEATLSEAAKVLLSNKVHSAPVVDGQGKVVGMLSQHDALRGMVAQQSPLL